jgi:myo-inositol-1(or 4)-monophosphatase
VLTEREGRNLLAIASEAAAQASELIRTHAPGVPTDKGDRDLTSKVDIEVEHFVRDFLRRKTPDAEFLGEEEGTQTTGSEYLWVLDPLPFS